MVILEVFTIEVKNLKYPIFDIFFFSQDKSAVVEFSNASSADMFTRSHNRKMMDLAIITATRQAHAIINNPENHNQFPLGFTQDCQTVEEKY